MSDPRTVPASALVYPFFQPGQHSAIEKKCGYVQQLLQRLLLQAVFSHTPGDAQWPKNRTEQNRPFGRH